MDTLSTDGSQYDAYLLAAACIFMPVLVIGVKRARERCQELAAAFRVRRVIGRKANIRRHRSGVVEELRSINDDTFQRMFRMPKRTFFELEARVAPLLRARRQFTIHSEKMACVSSGSPVHSLVLLASTIRQCAGHV
jgi:hypothetical protein